VVARFRGRSRVLAKVKPRRNGTFGLRPHVRVGRKVHVLRVHAVVRGVGRSHTFRVRLRRR